MKRRDLILTGGGAAAAAVLPRFAHAQAAYRAEYKMSTVVPPAFAWGKGGAIFADLVRERTAGRINIKQYPGSSLVQGQQDREFAAMRQGVIDVLCGAPINWAGTVRELGVFTLPFILPDHKAWDAATTDPGIVNEYFDLVRKAGAEPLAIGETGFRQISNRVRTIRGPDDMKGIDRCAGEPARGLPRREDSHFGSEVRDQVELFERHPAVRDRQPDLAKLDPGRPEDRARGCAGCRQTADRAGSQALCHRRRRGARTRR